MAKVLFLEDRSKRISMAKAYFRGYEVTVATNVLECLRLMSKETWDYISLDHDLGGLDFVDPDEKTAGMEIVRYLEKTAWPPEKRKPHIGIHSTNNFAATAMQDRLRKLGFFVDRIPFNYDVIDL
jgi:CheY-like chemotaxis protein